MHTLSLKLTGRPAAGLQAAVGTSPPAMWDSDDLTIRLWFDAATRTHGVSDPFDVADISLLTLEMRETPETSAMLIAAKTTSSFTECTLADFISDDGEHATITLTDTETNVVGTLDQVWLSFVATLDDGSRYTFGAGYVAIIHSGADQSAVVDPVDTYAQNAFKTIAVSGQSSVVADSPTDTLTISAGAGITITTNASTDTVTVTGTAVVSVDNRISRGDGTTAVQSSGWTIDDNDQASVSIGSGRTGLAITLSAATGTALELITTDSTTYPLKFTFPTGSVSLIGPVLQNPLGLQLVFPTDSGTLALTSDVDGLESAIDATTADLTWPRVELASDIDTAILGLTANASTKQIFSTLDHATPTYVRSNTCWARNYDLTAVSPWNSSHVGRLGGTAITARHVIAAAHSHPAANCTMRFVAADGTVTTKTVTAWQDCETADFSIGLLNSDLPATITPVRIMPERLINHIAYAGDNIPMLSVDQDKNALVQEIAELTAGGIYVNVTEPSFSDAQRWAFYEAVVDGDSGHPLFFIHDGELALGATWFDAVSGPATNPQYKAEIDAAISMLGVAGYTVQEVDWVKSAMPNAWSEDRLATPGAVLVTDAAGNQSIRETGWTIGTDDQAAVTIAGTSLTALAVTMDGDTAVGIQASATGEGAYGVVAGSTGPGGTAIYATNSSTTGLSVLAEASASGCVALHGSATTSGAIPLQLKNPDTLAASIGFLGTANRDINFPDASGTLMLTSAIGTTVQAYDADLTTWAGLTPGTFSTWRSLCQGVIPFSTGLSTAAQVTPTATVSASSASLVTYAYVAAGVAGVGRFGWAQTSMGSLLTSGDCWFGSAPVASWSRKWRFEFAACVSLGNHADATVSLHIGLTTAPATPARPATEGVSILFVGGASVGTVAIYSYDGAAGSTGATGSYPRGDETMKIFALEWEPGVGFRFYVDGVLSCSHASNLPTGAGATGGHETWWLVSNSTTNPATYPTGAHWFGGSVVFFI